MNKEFEEKNDPGADPLMNMLMVGGIGLLCGLIVLLQAAQAVIA